MRIYKNIICTETNKPKRHDSTKFLFLFFSLFRFFIRDNKNGELLHKGKSSIISKRDIYVYFVYISRYFVSFGLSLFITLGFIPSAH